MLNFGPARLLVTRPDTNAYGNATLNMATSFQLSRHLDATLCVAPVNPGRHRALTALECDGVRRWPASGIAARAGLALRHVARPLLAEDRGYFGLDLRRAYATRPLGVRLSAAVAGRLREARAALGLDATTPLVTLHVREGGYKAALGLHDREKDTARNARIETYVEAIDELVHRGYTVVRFGDPQMTPLRRRGVIDLATSPLRTAELEIWCVLQSRFFIASDSGPYNLSVLANVPCLAVNVTHHIGAYPLRSRDRYLLKRVFDTVSGREIGVGEMFTRAHLKQRWAPDRHRFVDNTAREIAEAVIEMEAVLDGETRVAARQQAVRSALLSFLDSDYGRSKQEKGGAQALFYPGDGWMAESFARTLPD